MCAEAFREQRLRLGRNQVTNTELAEWIQEQLESKREMLLARDDSRRDRAIRRHPAEPRLAERYRANSILIAGSKSLEVTALPTTLR